MSAVVRLALTLCVYTYINTWRDTSFYLSVHALIIWKAVPEDYLQLHKKSSAAHCSQVQVQWRELRAGYFYPSL